MAKYLHGVWALRRLRSVCPHPGEPSPLPRVLHSNPRTPSTRELGWAGGQSSDPGSFPSWDSLAQELCSSSPYPHSPGFLEAVGTGKPTRKAGWASTQSPRQQAGLRCCRHRNQQPPQESQEQKKRRPLRPWGLSRDLGQAQQPQPPPEPCLGTQPPPQPRLHWGGGRQKRCAKELLFSVLWQAKRSGPQARLPTPVLRSPRPQASKESGDRTHQTVTS